MQGYDIRKLPEYIQFFRPDGSSYNARTSSGQFWYHFDLFRAKGFVVDQKFLEPRLHDALENGGSMYEAFMGIDDGVNTPPVVKKLAPIHYATPRLALRIILLLSEQNDWSGKPADLFTLIGNKSGMPQSPSALSSALVQDKVIDALKPHGITVARERKASGRVIHLSKHW